MKIAIFHELDFGGARRTVYELTKRLNKIFDIDFYYVDSREDRSVKKFSKRVFFYPFYPKIWKGKDWRTRLYKDTLELYSLYRLHSKISKDIGSKRYDHIFIHPSKFTQSPFLLRLLKSKCIYFCQEPLRIVYDFHIFTNIQNIKFPKNLYEFLNRKIRKWIDLKNFNSAKMVLANSKFSKEFIKKSYGKEAVVCYLGVDTKLFKPLNLKKSIDVLFIGNKDNDYKLLTDAYKFFKKKPKIKTIFREKGQSITDKELAIIYNKSKALTALNQNEPFGLIPIEAMSCGTPVIALRQGGYNEAIVNKKTGFLISRNVGELYEKILKLISGERLRKRFSESARAHVLKNWTWEKSIERFLKIIEYEKG